MRKGLIALRLDGPPGGDARTGAAGRPLRDAPHRGEAAVVFEPHLAVEAQPARRVIGRLHTRGRHAAHHAIVDDRPGGGSFGAVGRRW